MQVKKNKTAYYMSKVLETTKTDISSLCKLGSKAFEEQKLEEAEAYLKQVKNYQDLMDNLATLAKAAGLTLPTTKVVKTRKLAIPTETKLPEISVPEDKSESDYKPMVAVSCVMCKADFSVTTVLL